MKKSRFSQAEIAQILAEAAEQPTSVVAVLKKYHISATTLRRWLEQNRPPPPPAQANGTTDNQTGEPAPRQPVPPVSLESFCSHPASDDLWERSPRRPPPRTPAIPAPGIVSRGAVVIALLGVVIVLSQSRCQHIHRLIALAGPVASFLALLLLVTPLSLAIVRQFRRGWWQSGITQLREGNGLVLFLSVVLLMVLNLVVLSLPGLICFLGNGLRALFSF